MNHRYPIKTVLQEDFPNLEIWKLKKRPLYLYAEGSEASLSLIDRLPFDGLAIVGTRYPQHRSTDFVHRIVGELKGDHKIIVSGLALGIDASAHRAALDHGLPTVAVLGTGLGQTFPSEHAELREAILARGGLVISEYEHAHPARKHQFLDRNRIISALSKAVLVVEAGRQSGALNTAKHARDQERDCFALPCFPGDPAFAGNEGLLSNPKEDRFGTKPFWGIHSLYAVWPELDAKTNGRVWKKNSEFDLRSDEVRLTHQVSKFSHQQNGANVQDLLDWALALEWTPQRFFDSLERAFSQRLLIDKNGLVLKNPDLYL